MIDFADFCTTDLKLGVSLPPELMASVADPKELAFVVEFGFPLAGANASTMGIKCAHGQSRNEPAAILELSVTRQGETPLTVAETLAWLDQAHTSVRGTFLQMTSPRLKDAMGPMKRVDKR